MAAPAKQVDRSVETSRPASCTAGSMRQPPARQAVQRAPCFGGRRSLAVSIGLDSGWQSIKSRSSLIKKVIKLLSNKKKSVWSLGLTLQRRRQRTFSSADFFVVLRSEARLGEKKTAIEWIRHLTLTNDTAAGHWVQGGSCTFSSGEWRSPHFWLSPKFSAHPCRLTGEFLSNRCRLSSWRMPGPAGRRAGQAGKAASSFERLVV